jgi:hypothetical protein
MGKILSLRLSDSEEARLRGAAAVAGMSMSAYLKWLVTNGKTGTKSEMEMILRRLDELAVAMANMGAATPRERIAPIGGAPARSAIVSGLKERGLPSSTIRQVEVVLDEVEGKAARVPLPA